MTVMRIDSTPAPIGQVAGQQRRGPFQLEADPMYDARSNRSAGTISDPLSGLGAFRAIPSDDFGGPTLLQTIRCSVGRRGPDGRPTIVPVKTTDIASVLPTTAPIVAPERVGKKGKQGQVPRIEAPPIEVPEQEYNQDSFSQQPEEASPEDPERESTNVTVQPPSATANPITYRKLAEAPAPAPVAKAPGVRVRMASKNGIFSGRCMEVIEEGDFLVVCYPESADSFLPAPDPENEINIDYDGKKVSVYSIGMGFSIPSAGLNIHVYLRKTT